MDSTASTLYQIALADHAGPVTVLHLDAEDSTILAGSRAEPTRTWRLPLGSRKTASAFFQAALPSAL